MTASRLLLILLLTVFTLLLNPPSAHAQGECGIVDNITYPVDSSFVLTQQYAIPSPRHQGRFHTGEDWYGGDRLTEGQPVRPPAGCGLLELAPFPRLQHMGIGHTAQGIVPALTFGDGLDMHRCILAPSWVNSGSSVLAGVIVTYVCLTL